MKQNVVAQCIVPILMNQEEKSIYAYYYYISVTSEIISLSIQTHHCLCRL